MRFEQYKGVNLIYSRKTLPPTGDGLQLKDFNPFAKESAREWSSAVVGDRFVLFANAPEVLRKAINDAQVVDLNLQGSPTYQKAIARLDKQRIGVLLADVPQLSGWLGGDSVKPDSQLPDTLAIGLGLTRQGLLADTVWTSNNDESTVPPDLDHPVAALNYIPEESAVVLAGHDLASRWRRLSQAVSGADLLSRLLTQPLAELENRWGISLEEDIFSWVTRDYALALLPNVDQDGLDWIFVADDPPQNPQSQAAIQRLDEAAAANGYSVGPFTLKDQHRILAWTRLMTREGQTREGNLRLRLEADVLGVRGQLNDYRLLASSIEAIDWAYTSPRRNSLLANGQFRKELPLLPDENDGYLYLNWQQSQGPLRQQLPFLRVLELTGNPLFDHVRSLLLTTEGSENGVHRAQVLVKLSP